MQTQQLVAQGRLPAAHSSRAQSAGQVSVGITAPALPTIGVSGVGGGIGGSVGVGGVGVGGVGVGIGPTAGCTDWNTGGPCTTASQACTDPSTGYSCGPVPVTTSTIGVTTPTTMQNQGAIAAYNQNQMIMWGVGGLLVVGIGAAVFMMAKPSRGASRENPRRASRHHRKHRRSHHRRSHR